MWLSTLAIGIAQHHVPLHCAFGQLFRCGQRLLEFTLFHQRTAAAHTFNQGMDDVVHGLRTGYAPCSGCTYRSTRLREDPAEEHGPPCPKCGTLKKAMPRALWNQADAARAHQAPYTLYRGTVQDMFALTPPPGRILRAPRMPTGIEFPLGLAGHFSFRLCFRNVPQLHCFTQWPMTVYYQEALWRDNEEGKGYELLRTPQLHHLSPEFMRHWEVRVSPCGHWVVCEGEV